MPGLSISRMALTLTPSKGGGFDLRGYLSSLSDGFLFDYTDPDWLRQEPLGTTAVSATNDVIGLALSRRLAGQNDLLSRYLAGQPELRGGGTLGFAGTAPAATYNTSTGVGTASRVDFTNQSGVILPATVGRTYALDIEAVDGIFVRGASTVTGGAVVVTVAAGTRATYFVSAVATGFPVVAQANGSTASFTVHSFKEVSRAAATQAGSARPRWQGAAGASFDLIDDNHLTGYLVGSGDEFLAAKIVVPASIAATQIAMGKADSSFANSLFWGIATDGQVRYAAGGMATTQAGPDLRGQTIVAGITCGPAGFRVFAADEEIASGALTGSAAGASPVRIGALNNAGTAGSFFGGSIIRAVGGKDRIDLARFRQIASQL